jgi:hypothetical protein
LKIINTSNKPYEFTWDGGHYGPIQPGEIKDYPDPIAYHAIKRSVVYFHGGEQDGEISHFQMEMLDAVDKSKVSDIALYECPFIASNQCDAKPFKSADDLRAHLESHWELIPETPRIVKQGTLGSGTSRTK